MSDKTEQPTPRRLRKAREQGDSPVSGALMQAVGFLAALALAPAAVAATAVHASELLRAAIERGEAPASVSRLALVTAGLVLPLVGAGALLVAAAGFVQTGGAVAFHKLAPDLSRANPFTGLQHVVSGQRFVGVLRALLAALLVGFFGIRLIVDHAGDLANATGDAAAGAAVAGTLAWRLGWLAALAGLFLAGLDLLVTRYAWLRRHRMTKDEVKREFRETEGDPEIKAARRRAHQEMMAGAMLNAVRDATVVIVNPTHLATALCYAEDEGDETPRVVAQGQGELARRIVAAAHAYGIPVVQDIPVARALQELDVGDEIPEALYEAVAEILREIWRQESGERA
jgi:flagellar biosynthesis protein FlhB